MPQRGSLARTVALLMEEARRKAGSGVVLAERIEHLVGRRYDVDSVSAWATGRTMPPADALLAAAKVTGLSLSAALIDTGSRASIDWSQLEKEREELRQRLDVEGRIDELRHDVDQLQDQLRQLQAEYGGRKPASRPE